MKNEKNGNQIGQNDSLNQLTSKMARMHSEVRNRLKTKARLCTSLLLVSLFLFCFFSIRWVFIDHSYWTTTCCALILALGFWWVENFKSAKHSKIDEKTALLMIYDKTLSAGSTDEKLYAELERFESIAKMDLLSFASRIIPLALITLVIFVTSPTGLSEVFRQANHVVQQIRGGIVLKIRSGAITADTKSEIELSSMRQAKLTLYSENSLSLQVNGIFESVNTRNPPPRLELRKKSNPNEIYQSFLLEPNGQSSNYVLNFSVDSSVDLFLPAISSKPLAEIEVKTLPLPEVSLTPLFEPSETQTDNRPVKFAIQASAQNGIALVSILIRVGQKQSEELVTRVIETQKKELNVEHELFLEKFVDEDTVTVNVAAEAFDKSAPKPLVGRSQWVEFTVMSAYGVYKKILAGLREVKTNIEAELQSENPAKLDKKSLQEFQDLELQSHTSPFFDDMDRSQLSAMVAAAEESSRSNDDPGDLGEVLESINRFLFDHETLDQRERDRDFFVAIRNLSRLVEKPKPSRSVTAIEGGVKKIIKFLDERNEFWKARIERLGENARQLKYRSVVQQKPFHAAVSNASTLTESSNASQISAVLRGFSQASQTYRQWIEELEAAEDQAKKENEQKRNTSLANIRELLRDLQRNQDEVSQELDRAETRGQEEMKTQWESTRPKQNSNINKTKEAEAVLREHLPQALPRMRAALDHMNNVVTQCSDSQYGKAESSADAAGRLLRIIENSASKSQQSAQQRGRRKRIQNDQSYGYSSEMGVIELKRSYEVDSQYRQQILDSVRQDDTEAFSEEQKKVREKYIQEVIR